MHICSSGPDVPKSGTTKVTSLLQSGVCTAVLCHPACSFPSRNAPVVAVGSLCAGMLGRRVWLLKSQGQSRHLVLPGPRTGSCRQPLPLHSCEILMSSLERESLTKTFSSDHRLYQRTFWENLNRSLEPWVVMAVWETPWGAACDDRRGFG